ncbi:MAG: mucoidy inhibitor MuiA family protein [Phycisphaerae bacterium]|nr:mucoidy inhibitor MuiA family protein [Phycisphaerae bacterium]
MLHGATIILSLTASIAFAQEPKVETLTPTAPIGEVTLYQGRAMISRMAAAPEREGLFELRFTNLPAAIDADSVQATVSAPKGGAKLLDVRFEATRLPNDANSSPELKKAIEDLEAAQRAGQVLAMRAQRLKDQNDLLNAIAAKTATESAKDFGSKSLDPAALAAQVEWLGKARNDLIAERTALDIETLTNHRLAASLDAKVNALGGRTLIERTAIVTLGKSSAAPAEVTLRYLVGDATWTPKYAARADMEAKTLSLEYDAQILQNTGESWENIKLTLSTAQPTQRAQPNGVQPIVVDVFVPPPITGGFSVRAAPGAPTAMMDAPMEKDRGRTGEGGPFDSAGGDAELLAEFDKNQAFEALFSDAVAVQSGTVANFPINRSVTIPSDAQKARTQRIATIDLTPTFVHVTQPVADPAVFIKATAANSSPYQLLAGPITVFLGGDSVGRTQLPDLSSGSEMTFWLGTDRRIESKRQLVRKGTAERGVFGKSDVTEWVYRIDLANTLASPLAIEVYDRMPVSRNEQVKVTLAAVTPALAGDAKYIADEKPQGILKWVVTVPAAPEAGKPGTLAIDWTVREEHAQGTLVTPIPD